MDPELNLLTSPLLLSWTDAENGEDLCILVHGPPEFLEELREGGFEPAKVFDTDGRELPSPRVVVTSS